MKDAGSSICVKNISDLVLKAIYGICETKNSSKEQVNEYKIKRRQIYKKFTNLSQEELNTKNNKKTYVKNDVMTTVIKRFRGEKTRGGLMDFERFIRTLKNKILKHMTAISKNICFDELDDIVNKYNNTVHGTIKMKPIDITGDSYVKYNEDFNKKDPKFMMIMLELQNIKTFLLKDIHQIG